MAQLSPVKKTSFSITESSLSHVGGLVICALHAMRCTVANALEQAGPPALVGIHSATRHTLIQGRNRGFQGRPVKHFAATACC
jgi:hypothetical protein